MNELPSVLSFSCVGITKNIVIFGKAAVIPCLCFPYQFQCSVAVAVSAASVFLELKIFGLILGPLIGPFHPEIYLKILVLYFCTVAFD